MRGRPCAFEWDEEKRRANIEKHGFDFIWARQLFDSRLRFDFSSPRGSVSIEC